MDKMLTIYKSIQFVLCPRELQRGRSVTDLLPDTPAVSPTALISLLFSTGL